ncbi:Cytosolic carboxypeptidase 4 [Liparis tanakae]|uniref:Cytosolic carboxypeptidase 4 n=1 Tax=Liparis tanakae TaxID=230148 RepID=A0A4Z2ENF9_9TELE|nr:Cytosolic carboxypeptidase 4 [Liparis tanakae]
MSLASRCSVDEGLVGGGGDEEEEEEEEVEEVEEEEDADHRSLMDGLLQRHGACVPHHEPRLYRSAAASTSSIPGFSVLAFPDFWGHLPPPGPEPMSPRTPHIQRYADRAPSP